MQVARLAQPRPDATGRRAAASGRWRYAAPRLAAPTLPRIRSSLQDAICTRRGNASFVSVLCLDGQASLCCGDKTLTLNKGGSAFVPANAPEFTLEGAGTLLLTTI